MSSPLSSAKTDPAEYERMQQEYRRAARRENAIATAVIGVLLYLLFRLVF